MKKLFIAVTALLLLSSGLDVSAASRNCWHDCAERFCDTDVECITSDTLVCKGNYCDEEDCNGMHHSTDRHQRKHYRHDYSHRRRHCR